jgi:Predicted membrane protein
MAPNLSKIPASSIIVTAAIAFFCISVVMSIASYPPPFSPLDNWMSDLGNPELNPAGSVYFNLACVITGLLLVGFYLGLKSWRSKDDGNSLAFTVAQGSGVFSGIALAGIGIFPETFSPHHFITSVLFFLSSTVAILLAIIALRGSPRLGRATTCAGYLTLAIGIVFSAQMALFKSVTIIEWISVLSMLFWAGLAGVDMYRGSVRQLVTQQTQVLRPSRRS